MELLESLGVPYGVIINGPDYPLDNQTDYEWMAFAEYNAKLCISLSFFIIIVIIFFLAFLFFGSQNISAPNMVRKFSLSFFMQFNILSRQSYKVGISTPH
jgi:hypothetical protein